MTNYHEPVDLLDEKTRNITRAISSLKEELEAIDWYNQRVVASKDAELSALMAHNRDEEMEHACMALEWLRRNMDGWEENLRTYLFTSAPITEVEEMSMNESSSSSNTQSDLNIGTMK